MTGDAGSTTAPTDLLEEEARLVEPTPFRKGDPGIDKGPLPGKEPDGGAGRGGYAFVRYVRQAGSGGKVRDAMISVTFHKKYSPSMKTCCTALGWIRVVLVTRQLSIQFAILRTSVSETSLDITSSEKERDKDKQTDRCTDRQKETKKSKKKE